VNEPVTDAAITPGYLALRTAHFRFTLKTWYRGLDKALLTIVGVLSFILAGILALLILAMTRALALLITPDATLPQRAAVIVGWQVLSYVLLRALREAVFRPGARPFFDSLPITTVQKLRADLLLSMLGYSFLWLPVGVLLIDPFDTTGSTLHAAIPLFGLVSVSLCLNIALLRAVLPRATLPCAAPSQRHRIIGDRLALVSGLVLPLLIHQLRTNLLLRIGCIAAALGTCLLIIALRAAETSTASMVVFVAATATLALYALPALCRNTLLTRLEFLAGQPAFARRIRLAAYGIPAALFAISLAVAGLLFDHSTQSIIAVLIFTALFTLGVYGARIGWQPTVWLMPLCTLIAVIMLGDLL
jgi:hypothetical protein